jgi:hypothetical protein
MILTCNKGQNMENGCKQNTKSQHGYFRKNLHVFFSKKNLFDMNEFWNNVFAICYLISTYSCHVHESLFIYHF